MHRPLDSSTPTPDRKPPARTLLALPLTGLTSCAAGPPAHELSLEELAARHDALLVQQEILEAEFVERNPMPLRLEFDDRGDVLVRECRLDGRLGREEVVAQLTYVNTTGVPIRSGHIALAVVSPDGEIEHVTSEPMILPFGLRFHANSTYTTTLSTPTKGVHKLPGWKWETRIVVEFYDPPTP